MKAVLKIAAGVFFGGLLLAAAAWIAFAFIVTSPASTDAISGGSAFENAEMQAQAERLESQAANMEAMADSLESAAENVRQAAGDQ